MRNLTRTLTAVAALLAALPAAAQQPFALDEIVFSATRIPTPRESVGVAVTVVGRDEIARAGDQQLSAFLARLPGVSVDQLGPLGAQSNLRMRGSAPGYVAVFIDGIRVDDPTSTTTAFDFGALTTADIGRIEILRGSQSAVWGGSAVAGVINISTLADAAEGVTQTFGLEGGSFGTLGARYGFTRRAGPGVLAFNLSHRRSDGFSAADENEGNTEADGFASTRASLSLRHALTDEVTLGFSGFLQRSRADYDAFGGPGGDADFVQRRREAGARVFVEVARGDSRQEIGLSGYRVERRNIDNAPRTSTGDRIRLDWLGSTDVGPGLTLVYGADTQTERGRYPNLPGGSESTRVSGAFLQGLWAPRDDLDAALVGRVDRNSDFGNFFTGRASVAWRPASGTTLRAALARGFRAPSIDERFGDYSSEFFTFVGNPDLQPERSRSAEIGVDVDLANGMRLSGTLFRLDITNLIGVNETFTSLRKIDGRSKRQGIELEGRLPVGQRVELAANYTYTDARSQDGTRIGRIPRHALGLTVDAQITDRLRNTTTVRALAGRPVDGFPPREMSSFAVVNTAFAWALTDRTELTLRIDNVFDRQYQLAAGYGTSDRALYVGLAGRF
jgi:vitamin B12 transporter